MEQKGVVMVMEEAGRGEGASPGYGVAGAGHSAWRKPEILQNRSSNLVSNWTFVPKWLSQFVNLTIVRVRLRLAFVLHLSERSSFPASVRPSERSSFPLTLALFLLCAVWVCFFGDDHPLGWEQTLSKRFPWSKTKTVKRNHSCCFPRLKEDDGDKEEKLVHHDSVMENNEPYLGKLVKFKNKLWVIKDIKANEVLEIEAPYSRRVKLVTRKRLRLC
ncbi:hypothetical protein LR48_Vigan09g081300 [Vigna angularis]|uniref:Uncharacterized protein n=1 Tax=Phaseolus angularis TaxID=3914 RepID=A0A0L9VBX1_PHAAN|nr:hypothetical protein LR48_Vigan09g081300 [Vigna angularis]